MNLKFLNKTVCLDLKSSTSYKQKRNLIDLLTRNGLKVSFILKKGIFLLIKNDKYEVDTYSGDFLLFFYVNLRNFT